MICARFLPLVATEKPTREQSINKLIRDGGGR
jgi:hypothetical protein